MKSTSSATDDEPRKPGRPREFDGVVSVRLTRVLHDDLSREALRQRKDLSDVIRERLAIRISK
jgi:predicted HicB family RNase H-like nuclease